MPIWGWRMTDARKPLEPDKTGLIARLLRPGWADAERTFPVLRKVREPIATDRTGAARPDRDMPQGDWPQTVLRMHEDVSKVIDVVLRDTDTVLRDLAVLHPIYNPRIANVIERVDPATGALFQTDVNQGTHRVRYCQLRWPDASAADRKAYATFFREWRKAGLAALAVAPAADHEQRGSVIDTGAFGWCVGPGDRMKVAMEKGGRPDMIVSATRAFVTQKEQQLCT